MSKCENCICNPVCDHYRFGFENCGNFKDKSSLVIDTKYNIGDTVYVADLCYDYYPVSQPCTVKNILLGGNVNKPRISYEVKNDVFSEQLLEDWIFPTYAECTKWCEENNKIS